MKLGVLALWHEVSERGVVRQETVELLKTYLPDDFDRIVGQMLPTTMLKGHHEA